MANNPTSGIPSQTAIFPVSRDALNFKSKQGVVSEIPGCFYNQFVPTPATVTSGTVTNNGQSLIGALQLGGGTATVLPLGGDSTLASITSSSGALCTVTTSTFMPTTLNYDQYPIVFTLGTNGVLPTNLTAGTIYYAQWVSGTTFRLAASPNGTVIPLCLRHHWHHLCTVGYGCSGGGHWVLWLAMASRWLPQRFRRYPPKQLRCQFVFPRRLDPL